ncbi:RICIN domain-containing protein [Streptomyces sp. NBC_01324]|uniref:RICIN domain-containing protein n=1 Tax=Streptomyces sp. NBC_01324 TaxID=2903826 RepID=UPI002E15FE65|nr:RICIN domain-containing protein [Streptomyces sp. NBC_01324]
MRGAAGDPGDALAPGGALTPGGGRSGGTDASSTGPTTNSTARTPSPPSNGPENEGPENKGPENKGPENEDPENQDPENEGPENQDPEGKDAGEKTAERTNAGEATGTAEGGAAAIGAPEAPSTAPDATGPAATGQAEPSASSAPASPESSTSAAATASTSTPSSPDPATGPTAVRTVGAGPDEAVAAGAAGSGGAGANAHADGEPPSSRPKKPMLAAAAIVGAILIAVPFLVAGQDDREPEQPRTQNAAGTLLGSERSIVPDTYTSESPSPSVKPSKKVKEKEKEKQAPPPAPQQTLTPSPSASEKAKVKPKTKPKPKPKLKELTGAEKLRRWANGRSGVQNTVIRNASTSQCVDIANYGKGKPTAPVNQYPCNATTADNQLWSLDIVHKSGGPQNAPVFLIRNTKDGLCLDVGYYDARPAGSKVSEFNCRATGDNQLWWLDPRGDGTNWIRNVVSNDLCLRPTGGASAGNDARLVIAQCGAGDHWIV